MGLDITAYSNLKRVGPCPKADSEWDDNLVRVSDHPEIMRRGIEPGLYHVGGDHFGFRAGSYSGYNMWRAQLCRFTLGVDPKEVWNRPGIYKDKPFVELINFSDCEGYLGTEVSKKLLKDFQDHREAIAAKAEKEANWFMDRYDEWTDAFRLAADDGCVVFH